MTATEEIVVSKWSPAVHTHRNMPKIHSSSVQTTPVTNEPIREYEFVGPDQTIVKIPANSLAEAEKILKDSWTFVSVRKRV
jgi:hypothetical protein